MTKNISKRAGLLNSIKTVAASLVFAAPVAKAVDVTTAAPPARSFSPDASQSAQDSWYHNCAVVLPLYTRHFPNNGDYNNHNYGLIGECNLPRLGKNFFAVAGDYKNSFDRNTGFAGLKWMPLHIGPVSFGVVGAVDLTNGYNFKYAGSYSCHMTITTNGKTVPDCQPTKLKNNNPMHPFMGALLVDVDLTKKSGLSFVVLPGVGERMKADMCTDESKPAIQGGLQVGAQPTRTCETARVPMSTAISVMYKLKF